MFRFGTLGLFPIHRSQIYLGDHSEVFLISGQKRKVQLPMR